MHGSYYPATLHSGTQGYTAEFADLPLSCSGETVCDATDNAIAELQAYAERLREAGSRLPPPSKFPGHPEWRARETDAYILVPL